MTLEASRQDRLSRRGAFALALLATGQLILAADFSIVYVALPSIEHGLRFSEQTVQWVVSAYALTFGGFLLLGGRASDLLGRRRMFIGAQIVFGVGTLVAGLTPSPVLLIAARALQGLAAAFLAPATISLINTTFAEGPQRNRALGVWGAAGAGGFAIGVLLGGIITQWLGWRWVFLVNVPICVSSALLAPRLLRESRNTERAKTYDVPGAIAVTAAVVLFVFALVRAPEQGVGWGSWEVLASLVLSAGLAGAFFWIESRSPAPLMPLRLFRSRMLSSANIVAALFQASAGVQLFLLTIYAQTVLHYSPLDTGLAFLPLAILLTVCSNLSGRLATVIGVRATLTIGMALATVGLILMAQLSAHGTYVHDILAGSMITGIGQGLTWTAMFIGGTAGVRDREQGVASSLVNSFIQIGGAVGLAILVGIVTSRTRIGGGGVEAAASGLRVAYYVAAGIAASGAAVGWFLTGRPPHVNESDADRASDLRDVERRDLEAQPERDYVAGTVS